MLLGFSVGTIASYIVWSLQTVNSESALMLTFFNLFFIFTIFPLNGSLKRKTFLLVLGNFLGLVWNLVFSFLVYGVTDGFAASFNASRMILTPFVNLAWIVTFWSVSLSLLVSSKDRMVEATI
jgi:hypothetical protein